MSGLCNGVRRTFLKNRLEDIRENILLPFSDTPHSLFALFVSVSRRDCSGFLGWQQQGRLGWRQLGYG